jgi:hypothetical protein
MNISTTAVPAQSGFISFMYGFYSVITPAIFVIVIIMLLLFVVVFTIH